MPKEEGVCICFLHAETTNNQFFSATDIGYHPPLTLEKEMLSSAYVNAALTRTMNDNISANIRLAGKGDQKWPEPGRELVRMRESRKKIPTEETEATGLVYYNNRLYIP